MKLYEWVVLVILIVIIAILILSKTIFAADIVIHQTYPGTDIRDYSAPSVVITDDGTGFITHPGTDVRDYSQPGLTIERSDSYEPIRPVWNQHRIDQPVQQALPYVWTPQD